MSKYDTKELTAQVQGVLEYSQNYNVDPEIIAEMMANWEINKQWFIEKNNGELIYECPDRVEISFTKEAKDLKFSNFVDWVVWNVCSKEFTDYVCDQGADALFDNEVKKEYQSKSFTISTGTKFLRSFKHFIKDKSLLNEAQSEGSRVIQTKKIEGTLCFSVHPLDFLSVSENTHNWRSCHALDGEYRYGGPSFMQDASSIVMYIRSDDKEKLPHFPETVPWNSKKWRMMVYFSDKQDAIMLGRPYPYALDNITDLVNNFLKEFFPPEEPGFDLWHDDLIKEVVDKLSRDHRSQQLQVPYFMHNGMLFPLSDVVHDALGYAHYNDLLESTVYLPIYTTRRIDRYWRYDSVRLKTTSFNLGGEAKCLKCGESVAHDLGTMLCENCYNLYESEAEDIRVCEICGHAYHDEDMWQVGDDYVYFCANCFNDHAFTCECCGNAYMVEERHKVDEDGELLDFCDWCYRDKIEKANVSDFKKIEFKPVKAVLYDKDTEEQIMEIPVNGTLELTEE